MERQGYCSIEEHILECIEFFLLLQRGEAEEKDTSFHDKLRQMEEKTLATEIFLPAKYLKACYGLTVTEYWLVMFAFCCEVEEGLCLAFREKYHEKWPSLQYALHLLSAVLPVDFRLIGELCGKKSAISELLHPYAEGAAEGGCLTRPLLLARAPFYFLLTGEVARDDWYTLFLPQIEDEREGKAALPPPWSQQGGTEESAPPLPQVQQEEKFLPLHDLMPSHDVLPWLQEGGTEESASPLPQAQQRKNFLPLHDLTPLHNFLPLHEKEYIQIKQHLKSTAFLRLLLHGSRGCGKHVLLQRACGQQGKNAVFVRFWRLCRKGEGDRGQALCALRFLCKLLAPLVVFELCGEDFVPDTVPGTAREQGREQELLSLINEEIAVEKVVFLTENPSWLSIAENYANVKIFLTETLSAAEQKSALDRWLTPEERQEWQEELLARFHMNIGELARAHQSLRIRAAAECVPMDDQALWEEVLTKGTRSGGLGKLVEERAGLEEIILPQDCRKQLETVLKLAKVWTGKQGMQILFHGSSGTGKTMAASILARQLQRPLFKVDLSRVFDKYVGETEKHIDGIFQEAERGSYVLFFDEADALFAKRTGIQDSHDRYANASTSYLLARMEEYRGILILATNLIDHFDDAFVRRIRFVIRFRNLDEKGRELLWEKALSGEIPVGGDVSFAELARAAQLSPARISAAAQVAKLLAVCEEGAGADGGSQKKPETYEKGVGGAGICAADQKGSLCITRKMVWEALELEAGKDETRLQFTGGYSDGKGL